MTVEEILKIYGLPLQVVAEYKSELTVNTPDTPEHLAAKEKWTALAAVGWHLRGTANAQDRPETVGITAFSPPAAYAINVTGRGAWMLDRGGGGAYYELNFSGWIDSRLGTFSLNFYPEHVQTVRLPFGNWHIYITNCIAHVAPYAFKGIESLIVMAENALPIDYDLQRLKAARAYLNAASKYATEISVARQVAKQNAERELSAVRSDLSLRLQAEQNQLIRQKTEILIALQNEKRAALRDMQQLVLSAQQLRIP